MTTTAPARRATAAPTSTPKRKPKRRDGLAGWGFFAPFGVLFAVFMLWPIGHGVYLSLTDQSLTGSGGGFIGFGNYLEAFGEFEMWQSIGNTLWFTLLSTVPLVVIALVMALLVEQGLPGKWLWRLAFFMPYLLASTVVSLIWIWLFTPQLGAINTVLTGIGLPAQPWLQDPSLSMVSIVIATVWWTVGFNFLLYIAAIQGIPEQHYEAASLDGAGKWRQLFSITLPQLAPTTVVVVILQVLASLKVFDQIYQMMNQVVTPSTQSAIVYIFDAGFTGYRFGYASAVSYIFFAVVLLVSLVQFRITARKGA